MGGSRDFELLRRGCDQQAERFPQGNEQGVVGIGYGWIARAGAWTDDFGIVFFSAPGLPGCPDASVDVDGAQVPCCCFPLDLMDRVAAPAAAGPGVSPLRVGSPIQSPSFAGGIGGLMGTRALCAAHVFPDGPGFTFSFAGRRAGACIQVEPSVDAALLRLDAKVAARSATPDGLLVRGPRRVTEGDFDRPGYVYSPRRARTFKPYLLAANVRVYFEDGGACFGMLMTEPCTVAGDSGTPFLGADGSVLGVLSFGTRQFSCFTSITAIREVTEWF